MIIKYKLTNQKLRTYKDFLWMPGIWERAKGKPRQPLCTDAWFHVYDSPLIAILHNPLHANIWNPRLWKCEVRGETKNDNGLKRGYQECRLIEEIPVPNISLTQKIAYGILVSLEVYKTPEYCAWAEKWLSGEDRSAVTAYTTRTSICTAYIAAYINVNTYTTVLATTDAVYVAAVAADAIHDTDDIGAEYATAHAAIEVARIASVATHAVYLDLVKIAEKAMKY